MMLGITNFAVVIVYFSVTNIWCVGRCPLHVCVCVCLVYLLDLHNVVTNICSVVAPAALTLLSFCPIMV